MSNYIYGITTAEIMSILVCVILLCYCIFEKTKKEKTRRDKLFVLLLVSCIAALGAGITAVAAVGRERIFAHELELAQLIYDGLCGMNHVCLYTRRPDEEHHVPLLSFNVGGYSSEEAAALLAQRGIATRAGFHCAYGAHLALGTARRGAVRVCPSMFTTVRDVEALLRAVEEIVHTCP